MVLECYKRREKLIKVGFIFACFSMFFLWACMQPFDSCPDEKMRYVIPTYICDHFSLPNANDTSIIDLKYGFSYAAHPMLPYIISGIFMKITSFFTSSEFAMLMAARMTSILAGAGYVYFVMKISKYVSEKIGIQWLFIILCSLWPQTDFVFTYVNCDGLAMLAVAMIIYYWFKSYSEGWTAKNCLGISIGISISILSYLNTYIFIPLSVIVFILYYIFIDKSDKKLKTAFSRAMLIIGIVFLLTGWHFIRNMILYDGNILARGVNKFGELYGADGFRPSQRAEQAKALLSTFSGIKNWVVSTLLSFVGNFGYMNIRLPRLMYLAYAAEFALAVVGYIVYFIRTKFRVVSKKYIMGYVFVLTIISIVAMSFIFSFSDYQPQGRYILPALIPVCFLITKGISKIPLRKSNVIVSAICLVNIAVIIGCLFIIGTAY